MSKIPRRFEKSFIAKVQIPLASNEDEPMALIYNEDRRYEVYASVTSTLLGLMCGEHKMYFHVRYDRPNNNTVFERRAEWQDW